VSCAEQYLCCTASWGDAWIDQELADCKFRDVRRWLENPRQSTALLDDFERCVHIGDREAEIHELFCTADQMGTHFLIRRLSLLCYRRGLSVSLISNWRPHRC
jgi:hypothetical protein